MDPRLLDYYNAELAYIRELAQEFAEQHPKIAARLGMSGVEVPDPYVERLLEGFSFLTARVQLKMDQQFPHFSQRLLDTLYPNYLAPTPSMTIVALHPDMKQGSLATGFLIPKNSPLFAANLAKGEKTSCQFRTAHEVTLWPLEIVSVECTAAPPDLPLKSICFEKPVKGALCIRIKTTKGLLNALSLDQLTFYLAGDDNIASRLYERIFAHALGVAVCEPERPVKWMDFLDPTTIHPEGFDRNQSMIPVPASAFDGYRLLHEYFAFPQRFQFFTLTGLNRVLSRTKGDTLDFTILLDCPPRELENQVDKKHLALFCTPAINLFPQRIDNIKINPQRAENHIVADKNFPLNFEIYSVDAATGHEEEQNKHREFRPFTTALGSDDGPDAAYYTTRREPYLTPEASRRSGMRTNYIGSEIYLSLVDRNQIPLQHGLPTISVDTLCTNRDLALSIPKGETTDFTMEESAPIAAVKILHGPTEPKRALAEGETTWRLISHLDLNYLTLTDLSEDEGPQALRELLSLYAPLADISVRKQIESIRHSHLDQVARRIPIAINPLGYGYGISVNITVDEGLFGGTSPYLFGAILEQLFARHVGQFSFTETVLHSLQRGEITRWKPRMGKRPVA